MKDDDAHLCCPCFNDTTLIKNRISLARTVGRSFVRSVGFGRKIDLLFARFHLVDLIYIFRKLNCLIVNFEKTKWKKPGQTIGKKSHWCVWLFLSYPIRENVHLLCALLNVGKDTPSRRRQQQQRWRRRQRQQQQYQQQHHSQGNRSWQVFLRKHAYKCASKREHVN